MLRMQTASGRRTFEDDTHPRDKAVRCVVAGFVARFVVLSGALFVRYGRRQPTRDVRKRESVASRLE